MLMTLLLFYILIGTPHVELCDCDVSVGVDQWGEWSDWGTCSEACEDRLQMSVRICNQPQPPVGGDMCPGTDTKIRDCICEAFVSEGTLVSVLIASTNSLSQLRNLTDNSTTFTLSECCMSL